jgi:site-specific recombinase XerD
MLFIANLAFRVHPLRYRKEITYLEIEEFKAELDRSAKRINNILVPMRSVFTMAFKEGIIRDNVMARVDNRRIEEPTINPLSLDEVIKVLECVHPHYRNCLTIMFFHRVEIRRDGGLEVEECSPGQEDRQDLRDTRLW